jgi:hypothetical protein
MQLTVVSDSQGNIQSLSSVPQKGEAVTLTHILAAGERVDILDVPAEFEQQKVGDLHTRLRVTTQGGQVRLIPKA